MLSWFMNRLGPDRKSYKVQLSIFAFVTAIKGRYPYGGQGHHIGVWGVWGLWGVSGRGSKLTVNTEAQVDDR